MQLDAFARSITRTIGARRGRSASSSRWARWWSSEHAVIAHVGDSRAYRLRDGALAPMPIDHSDDADRYASIDELRTAIAAQRARTPAGPLDLARWLAS